MRVRLFTSCALISGAMVAFSLASTPVHAQSKTADPDAVDLYQKAFPKSQIPKEFYKAGKKPHGGGDPHAELVPEKLVKVALQHLNEGRRHEAMKTLDSGISKYDKNPKLRGIRGSIHLQHQDYAKALSDFEAALAVSPDDALLLVNRAQAYRSFKRFDEALADLDKAVELMPDLVAARFNRGAIYVQRNELEKAKADFERSIELGPHLAAPRFNLAITLDGLGQREEAVAEMKRFLKVSKQESWTKVAQEQLDAWKKMSAANSAAEDAAATSGQNTPTKSN